MKYAFTDTLIMTNVEFYVVLAICFVLGFPVGVALYKILGNIIKRIKK